MKYIIFQNRAFFIFFLNLVLAFSVFFMKDPLGYFEKTYEKAEPFFIVAAADISQIKISKNQKLVTDLRKKEKTWNVFFNEHSIVANVSNIDGLIKSLLGAKKFTKLDIAEDDDFGLKNPIDVEIFSKGKSLGSLSIGSTAPKGSYTYVKDKQSNLVYLVEDNLKSAVGRGETDFFYRKKLIENELKEEQLAAISVFEEEGNELFYLQKENKDWIFSATEQEKQKVNQDKIDGFISELNNLMAVKIIKKDDLKNFEKEQFKIEISYNMNGKVKKIEIQVIGKKEDSYFLQLPSNPFFVYELNKYSIEPILQKNKESFVK